MLGPAAREAAQDLLQLAATVISSWLAWPAWAAAPVTLLVAATLVTERRRWRWLVSANRLAN
ncbi:hypothetical protein [Streptomyces sp. LUP30]|uniref:hypothetical protein n=1 Tax=Streptomyces sp. LUP30 TaxID=1890285 RepID=UPI000851F530|nr:hypothetical protein [Streptomyces sp. LUP30]